MVITEGVVAARFELDKSAQAKLDLRGGVWVFAEPIRVLHSSGLQRHTGRAVGQPPGPRRRLNLKLLEEIMQYLGPRFAPYGRPRRCRSDDCEKVVVAWNMMIEESVSEREQMS